jgi:hypothetical protein
VFVCVCVCYLTSILYIRCEQAINNCFSMPILLVNFTDVYEKVYHMHPEDQLGSATTADPVITVGGFCAGAR